jgi:hypothetical protein
MTFGVESLCAQIATSRRDFIANDLLPRAYRRYRRQGSTREHNNMRVKSFVCAAIVAVLMPAVAMADDPKDPTMRSAAARARDHEIIRKLNQQELARDRERDARYAVGWRAARNAKGQNAEYAARSREHERAMANYARDRAQYEKKMAEWRRAVAACRAGDRSACDN